MLAKTNLGPCHGICRNEFRSELFSEQHERNLENN